MKVFETRGARLDVRRTFGYLRMGSYDPTCTLGDQTLVKTFAVADDAVARHTVTLTDAGVLRITVEGDSTADAWATQFPLDDGDESFVARREHTPLRYMVKELPGLRFVRVPWLFDFACGIVLQQRVTYGEALGQYRTIAERFGTRSPLGLAFPPAARLARVAPAELQALGVDARRAGTLIRLAREHALHDLLDHERGVLAARMEALPGIGPWTTGMVLAYGGGDPDAVPLGDLYLPHTIAQVLAGERRGSDERMLELLAPYTRQRARVIRLVLSAKFSKPALLARRR